MNPIFKFSCSWLFAPDDQIFIVYTDVQLFCHGTADMHHRKAVL